MGLKLEASYYQRSNVKAIAKDLLGKVLHTRIHHSLTNGIIVETEAYSYKEKGCHAYNYLRTQRTDVMFREGGIAYVYLCYGIHHLFNVVTNKVDKPEAVLIRAIEPLEGQQVMMRRMNYDKVSRITSGPGKLTKALGIDRGLNGKSLTNSKILIEDRGIKFAKNEIVSARRVGIDYAGNDASLPWRFYVKGSAWISRP